MVYGAAVESVTHNKSAYYCELRVLVYLYMIMMIRRYSELQQVVLILLHGIHLKYN